MSSNRILAQCAIDLETDSLVAGAVYGFDASSFVVVASHGAYQIDLDQDNLIARRGVVACFIDDKPAHRSISVLSVPDNPARLLAEVLDPSTGLKGESHFTRAKPDGAAADADSEVQWFRAPYDLTIDHVRVLPAAQLVANDAAYARLIAKIRAASGATVGDLVDTTTQTGGAGGTGTWTQFAPVSLAMLLSGAMTEGQSLSWATQKVGAGVIVPACSIVVSYKKTGGVLPPDDGAGILSLSVLSVG